MPKRLALWPPRPHIQRRSASIFQAQVIYSVVPTGQDGDGIIRAIRTDPSGPQQREATTKKEDEGDSESQEAIRSCVTSRLHPRSTGSRRMASQPASRAVHLLRSAQWLAMAAVLLPFSKAERPMRETLSNC
jgi:hypothetical protein